MMAQIYSDPREGCFLVHWTEDDGYVRERCFDSYRAAERFAWQVEFRLQAEALAEIESSPSGPGTRGR
jgi:hypothetical protein